MGYVDEAAVDAWVKQWPRSNGRAKEKNMQNPFKIECVVTCVNNADILAHTLPHNYHHFDKIVIVTAPEDKATQKVCEYYGVKCYATDKFETRWKKFQKGMGINEGFGQCDFDAWMLHMDADIVLPPYFRKVLDKADLDTSMIYGCDRAEFRSFEEWQRFYQSPEPQITGGTFLIHTTNAGKSLGTRVQFSHAGGYIPIGFFQLWHAASGIKRYPEGHSNAGREDTHFPMKWPRSKRSFLPEIVVYHLESEPGEMGVNWKGRQTRTFGIV